ncbi:MAG: hypothetical protein V8R91_02115 [Butyricimonas faecihominis]
MAIAGYISIAGVRSYVIVFPAARTVIVSVPAARTNRNYTLTSYTGYVCYRIAAPLDSGRQATA